MNPDKSINVLRREINARLKKIAEAEPMIDGSFYKVGRRCAKKSCHCLGVLFTTQIDGTRRDALLICMRGLLVGSPFVGLAGVLGVALYMTINKGIIDPV